MADRSHRRFIGAAVVFGVAGLLVVLAILALGFSLFRSDSAESEASAAPSGASKFAPFDNNDEAAPGESAGQAVSLRAEDADPQGTKSGAGSEKSTASTDTVERPAPATQPYAGSGAAPKGASKRESAPENAPPVINKDDIQRVLVDQYKPVAKGCYEKMLREFPDTAIDGRVVVSFDIIAENGEGRVELAEPGEDSTLVDERLHDCMLAGLGDVVFPVPEGNGTLRVNYPFNFASADPAAAAQK